MRNTPPRRSGPRTAAWLCVGVIALTGCEYDQRQEPPPTPPPDAGYRPPPPPVCPRGMCGDACCGTFPGSVDSPDAGLGVLYLVRTDRSLANLALTYQKMLAAQQTMLFDAGFSVRVTAVASLYDGRLLWANGRGWPVPSLGEVLKWQAANAPAGVPQTCTASGLATLARQFSTAEVVYPPGVLPPGVDPNFRPRPFEIPVTDLLIVMIDHGDRPLTAFAEGCKQEGLVSYDYFSPPTTMWIDNMQVPRLQTRFVFIHTQEEVPFEQYRSRCQSSGLPAIALDAVEPSEIAFFRGFDEGLRAQQPSLAIAADLCDAAGSYASATQSFASAWARELIDANPPRPAEPLPTP